MSLTTHRRALRPALTALTALLLPSLGWAQAAPTAPAETAPTAPAETAPTAPAETAPAEPTEPTEPTTDAGADEAPTTEEASPDAVVEELAPAAESSAAPAPSGGTGEQTGEAEPAEAAAPATSREPAVPQQERDQPEAASPTAQVSESARREDAVVEIVATPAAASAATELADAEEEVLIGGTRVGRTAGSAHVIRSKQLERFEYDDAHAILLQVPGVYVRQEDGVGLRPNIGVRGVNSDRSKKLTLMEDGVLFGPAPYSAPAAYYFPLMTRMSQVRVIKGPGAIAYGPQTVGGAVDLMTRRIPSTTSGALDLGVGQYGYTKADGYVGFSNEQVGFLIEGARLHNDGFKSLPDGDDTGFTRNEWMVKGSYLFDPNAVNRNELQLKLTYSDEVSNESYLGLTDADFREDPYQRYAGSALDQMKNHRTSIVVTHLFEAPESSNFRVRTDLYRHDYHRAWRKLNRFRGATVSDVLADPSGDGNAGYYGVLTGELDSATSAESLLIGPNDRTFVSQGAQATMNWDPTTGPVQHKVQAGARVHYDSIRRKHSEAGYAMVSGQLVPDGSAVHYSAANLDETYALAVHAQDAISWWRLTLTPGARMEVVRSSRRDDLSGASTSQTTLAVLPGVGAFYALNDWLGVLGGAYRGFSPPAPGSEAEPEYSVNYEAGLRVTDAPLHLEAIGFYNDYSNLTDVCTLASGCVADNLDRQFDAGAADIYGVEVYAEEEVRLGEVRVPFTAAYTYTQAEFASSFASDDPIYGDVSQGDGIPYVPTHQLNATLAVEIDRVGVNVAGNFVSKMREVAGSEPIDETMHTDDQLWFDAGAYYAPLAWLRLYGNVRNVLGAENLVSRRPFGARPNAPRWVQVGAKVTF